MTRNGNTGNRLLLTENVSVTDYNNRPLTDYTKSAGDNSQLTIICRSFSPHLALDRQ